MNQIKAGILIHRSFCDAWRRLDAFLEVHREVALHIELAPEDGSGLVIRRDVTVRVGRETSGSARLTVAWGPCEGGPYLPFEGRVDVLAARNDEGSTLLVLTGSHVPPAGIAGPAFDFLVGNRIATAAARATLERLRAEIDGVANGAPR